MTECAHESCEFTFWLGDGSTPTFCTCSCHGEPRA